MSDTGFLFYFSKPLRYTSATAHRTKSDENHVSCAETLAQWSCLPLVASLSSLKEIYPWSSFCWTLLERVCHWEVFCIRTSVCRRGGNKAVFFFFSKESFSSIAQQFFASWTTDGRSSGPDEERTSYSCELNHRRKKQRTWRGTYSIHYHTTVANSKVSLRSP